MSAPLPPDAATAIRSYLRAADRVLPGGIIACAVTGSIALGAYRPGRSDIDLVAVIADEWLDRPDLIRRLRLLHLSQGPA
ncbi:nucleotidyltransferase domain-containing protein [Brevibacterium permense]|uniref:Polymerase nucleotidyl transferase domain-containing protein n=1 Tax=Brevibacterium permense TaxID=234834 RepID=A0ABP4LIN8_9MICO|nr:nucleotidyltransferase domain-containing protein [Brevibacterium permense]